MTKRMRSCTSSSIALAVYLICGCGCVQAALVDLHLVVQPTAIEIGEWASFGLYGSAREGSTRIARVEVAFAWQPDELGAISFAGSRREWSASLFSPENELNGALDDGNAYWWAATGAGEPGVELQGCGTWLATFEIQAVGASECAILRLNTEHGNYQTRMFDASGNEVTGWCYAAGAQIGSPESPARATVMLGLVCMGLRGMLCRRR